MRKEEFVKWVRSKIGVFTVEKYWENFYDIFPNCKDADFREEMEKGWMANSTSRPRRSRFSPS